MTRAPRKYPIESFGPEMLAALVRGSREPFDVPFTSFRAAWRFAMRLHSLRAQMRLHNHPLANVVQRATHKFIFDPALPSRKNSKNVLVPLDREAPCTVRLHPKDSEYTEILLKAGIQKSELEVDPLDGIPGAASLTEGEYDYLDQITRETLKKPIGS